jgi:hypothetical protein
MNIGKKENEELLYFSFCCDGLTRTRIWIRIEIKCWMQIRNESYPDPRHWLSFEELTFKYLKLVGFLHKQ